MIDHWTVQSSRLLIDDRWLRVRADDCRTVHDVVVAPYYVIEAPDFVSVVAFDAEDRIVLVRQYRHGIGAVCLEIPGGLLENGELDPAAAARRELAEETGYHDGNFTPLFSLAAQPVRSTNRAHIVIATGVKPGQARPEPAEDIEVELVTREEAMTLALEGGISNASHVGFLLLALLRTAR